MVDGVNRRQGGQWKAKEQGGESARDKGVPEIAMAVMESTGGVDLGVKVGSTSGRNLEPPSADSLHESHGPGKVTDPQPSSSALLPPMEQDTEPQQLQRPAAMARMVDTNQLHNGIPLVRPHSDPTVLNAKVPQHRFLPLGQAVDHVPSDAAGGGMQGLQGNGAMAGAARSNGSGVGRDGAETIVHPPRMAMAATGRRSFLWGVLVFVGVTVSCALLYQTIGIADFLLLSKGNPNWVRPLSSEQGIGEIKLKTVLKEAAMVDNTVILTTLNEAWAAPGSVLDLFLESFKTGDRTDRLLKHLVIVAVDEKAYQKCKSTHPHCYSLKTEGVDFSQEKVYMTEDYLKMMWRRTDFLRVVLEMGYDFIFTDADIMWFRDPSQFFYPDGDFQIACDHFNGNPDDLRNRPNGGFKYARSNNRTIEFYKFWHKSRERYPGSHDQDVLNFIKGDQFLRNIGLGMKFLPTANFGGLCEPSRDFRKVCTMHTNCCIGLTRKVNDLKVMLEDWRLYRALPPRMKGLGGHSWRVPQKCSLEKPN